MLKDPTKSDYMYSHKINWVSSPMAVITRRATFFCNVSDLNSRIINNSCFPVSWKHTFGPNPLAIKPRCYDKSKLEGTIWDSACVPHCPMVPAHEIPV